MTSARRTSTTLAATAALSAGALLFAAQGASASPTTCALDPVTHVLSVTVAEGKAEDGDASIGRSGDAIVVSELPSRSAVSCGATPPTVTNTERIEITTKGVTGVMVDLAGGALVPGVTPEADGSSEIEVVRVSGGVIGVEGGSGANRFQYLSADGLSGLNVDPVPGDQDVDVAVSGTVQNLLPVIALGGPGPDTIEALGRLPFVVAIDGEEGNDTLRAGGTDGALITGGAGRDRLFGSGASDILDPGRGADTVKALGGPDLITAPRDRGRDTIDCGGGKDLIVLADRADRLRSCEQTVAGGNRR